MAFHACPGSSRAPLGTWRDLIEEPGSNPLLQGALGDGPKHSAHWSPGRGCFSKDTRTSREPGRLKGTDAGRVCSKRSVLSCRQAAAAFLFPFKTLLSTSWNIGPEDRRE